MEYMLIIINKQKKMEYMLIKEMEYMLIIINKQKMESTLDKSCKM